VQHPARAPLLTTERLTLRPQRRSDFDLLVQLYTTDRSRFVGGLRPVAAVWRDFMNSVGHWPVSGMGGWAIDISATGQCIGEVAVCQPPEYPETEIGWVLFEGFEKQGFALEAATAARDYARLTIGAPSLVSYIDPDNAPSIRLAERLGGTLDSAASTPNGDPCLVYRYW